VQHTTLVLVRCFPSQARAVLQPFAGATGRQYVRELKRKQVLGRDKVGTIRSELNGEREKNERSLTVVTAMGRKESKLGVMATKPL
jgi:hypothetical protein